MSLQLLPLYLDYGILGNCLRKGKHFEGVPYRVPYRAISRLSRAILRVSPIAPWSLRKRGLFE
ncbi:hypothetical protein CA51_29940 [Rosistilla oblonga]|nr:hypothetical protein CA51_29940 [Rosistilla oblonga]